MDSKDLFSIKNDEDLTKQMDDLLGDLDLQVDPIVIKVVGVGGAGGNALNTIIDSGIADVDFIAVNTDVAALKLSKAPLRLILGKTTTKGRGAGADPQKGRDAALESEEYLVKLLDGSDMVFITAGMGGGTGTGAAPVVAEIAKSKVNALVVAIVTTPFDWEGEERENKAKAGIEELAKNVDAIIVVPNNRIIEHAKESTTCGEAFKMSDDVLRQAVVGVTGVVRKVLQINVDFEDVRKTMVDAGTAIIGVGEVEGDGNSKDGESPIVQAARDAMKGPLMTTPMNGAKSVLYSVESGYELPIREVEKAASLIKANAGLGAKITWGQGIDPSMGNKVRLTFIATGFDKGTAADDSPAVSSIFDNRNLTSAEVVSEKSFNLFDIDMGGSGLDVPTVKRRKK